MGKDGITGSVRARYRSKANLDFGLFRCSVAVHGPRMAQAHGSSRSPNGTRNGKVTVTATPPTTFRNPAQDGETKGAKLVLDDGTPPPVLWPCPDCAPKIVAFTSAAALRGHQISHRRNPTMNAPKTEQSSGTGTPDPVPLPGELALASTDTKLTLLEKQKRQAEVAIVEAEQKLSRFGPAASEDPLEREMRRTQQILNQGLLMQQLKQSQQPPAAAPQQQGVSMDTVINALLKGVEIGKGNNGHGTGLSEAVQTLNTLSDFADKRLTSQAGLPTTELGWRAYVMTEKMRTEAQDRREREARETATQDRVIELGQKAIDVVGKPLSDAVSTNVRERHWLPGDSRAAAPTTQLQPSAPMSPEQQEARLDQLIAQAQAAKQQLQGQRGMVGPPPPGPVVSPPPGDISSQPVVDSVQPIVPGLVPAVEPGQFHPGKRGGTA